MDSKLPIERREIHFSGRVQGVGFRYTARAIAQRLPVDGYVQNLSDGRVRLVVEGAADAISRLVTAIEAEMERYIDHTEVATYPASGEFAGFVVRH